MNMLFMLPILSLQLTSTVYSETCGRLDSSADGSTVSIFLLLDPIVPEGIGPNHGLRWFMSKDQTNITVRDDSRIHMFNVTLRINNFGPGDEAGYFVQFRAADQRECYTPMLNMKAVTHPGTTSSTVATTSVVKNKEPLGQSTGDENIGIDTSIVIASLCGVIIVIVISGTIILIRRKKRHADDNVALAKTIESPMSSRMAGDGESIYNEIDIDYQSRCTPRGCSGSREDLKPLTLPRRPDNQKKLAGSSNEASTPSCVRDRRSSSLVQNVYSEIGTADKSPQPSTSSSKDYMKMYATVVPKKHRINKNEKLDIDLQYLYAKPVTKSGKNANEPTDEQKSLSICDKYRVDFPKIDVDTLNTTMGDVDRSKLVSMTEENFEAAVCRAGVYRSQRRKSSRRNELNYIELDHSGKNTDTILSPQSSQDPGEKMEYVAIDFEKKAFVAPARKPPSSWYKRKNKKKRY